MKSYVNVKLNLFVYSVFILCLYCCITTNMYSTLVSTTKCPIVLYLDKIMYLILFVIYSLLKKYNCIYEYLIFDFKKSLALSVGLFGTTGKKGKKYLSLYFQSSTSSAIKKILFSLDFSQCYFKRFL